jgi:hypothetical protein
VQLYIFAFFTMVDWASLILHGWFSWSIFFIFFKKYNRIYVIFFSILTNIVANYLFGTRLPFFALIFFQDAVNHHVWQFF